MRLQEINVETPLGPAFAIEQREREACGLNQAHGAAAGGLCLIARWENRDGNEPRPSP